MKIGLEFLTEKIINYSSLWKDIGHEFISLPRRGEVEEKNMLSFLLSVWELVPEDYYQETKRGNVWQISNYSQTIFIILMVNSHLIPLQWIFTSLVLLFFSGLLWMLIVLQSQRSVANTLEPLRIHRAPPRLKVAATKTNQPTRWDDSYMPKRNIGEEQSASASLCSCGFVSNHTPPHTECTVWEIADSY